MKQLLLTLPELGRRAGISLPTLRLYADVGLIECFRDTRGNRLFLEAAIDHARKVRESRTGKPRATA
jgi:DNA-binding transcriptional MerR regulator